LFEQSVLDPPYFGVALDGLDCGSLEVRHWLNSCGGFHLRGLGKEAFHSLTNAILQNSKVHYHCWGRDLHNLAGQSQREDMPSLENCSLAVWPVLSENLTRGSPYTAQTEEDRTQKSVVFAKKYVVNNFSRSYI
jgi:hypothetical protein